MAQTSYGSITIVDITDIGEFSVYPKCNLPTTVIYSPDLGTYTPSWNTNYLEITPVAYYAGSQVSTNLSWVWEKQEGNGSRTTISNVSGVTEIAASGKLTVKTNYFSSSVAGQITFYITATYNDSTLGQSLVAEGQITFSKIQQGSSAKTAKITGDNIFKYNTNSAIVGSSSITLTGAVTNCSISSWQYYNTSNSTWTTYPNSSASSTLTVNESDSTFSNDKVTIKLVTNDNDTYDTFTIYKLRDGAAGTSVISAVLTNEDQMIAANSSGTPVSYSGAVSTVKVLMGGNDITSTSTITITGDPGIGFSSSKSDNSYDSNDTATVSSMTVAAGNIYFQCTGYAERADLNANTYVTNRYYTYSNNTYTKATGSYNSSLTYYEYYNLTKTFSLIKVQAGADATTFSIYNLNVDTLALNYNGSAYVPNNIVATAKETQIAPTGTTEDDFYGKFRITESYSNGTNDTITYTTTSSTEYTKPYTPTAGGNVSKILIELLDSSGNTVLDKQTIIVTKDGQDGDEGPQGPQGDPAYTIIIQNQAQVFPCTNSNYPVSDITIEIPFAAYKGTSRIAASIANTNLLGISPHSDSHAATTSADGLLKYIIPTSTQITNSNGSIDLVITCDGKTFHKSFNWTRSSAAKDGINGITLLLFTPDGTYFDNGTGTINVEAYLQDGSTDKTSNTTWTWYQWSSEGTSSGYVALGTSSSANAYYTNKTLTVKADAVDGYCSFKVKGTYGGKDYYQYISLVDKTDPIQITVFSTLGNQIVNGQGSGALYARVLRTDGVEIDPIGDKGITAGTTSPSGGVNGDYYILLNETNKTAILYYKNNGSWAVRANTATYEWTFRDSSNTPITNSTTLSTRFGNSYNSTTGKVTGKCLYIDKNTVDNKLTADVKVII